MVSKYAMHLESEDLMKHEKCLFLKEIEEEKERRKETRRGGRNGVRKKRKRREEGREGKKRAKGGGFQKTEAQEVRHGHAVTLLWKTLVGNTLVSVAFFSSGLPPESCPQGSTSFLVAPALVLCEPSPSLVDPCGHTGTGWQRGCGQNTLLTLFSHCVSRAG